MATQPTIALEQLLAPIPGANPAGISLRDPSLKDAYFLVKGNRDDSGKIERGNVLDPSDPNFDLNKRKWGEVVKQATEILLQRAKDHEVAAWLCEALLREQGFAGLRDGLRLCRELSLKYWDSWLPPADAGGDDDWRLEIRPFVGLFRGVLTTPIRLVALTQGEAYNSLQYEQAKKLEKADAQEKQARIARGAVTLQKIQQQARETPVEFYRDMLDDLQAAVAELESLSNLLKEKNSKEENAEPPPSSREVVAALQEVTAMVRELAGDRPKQAADAAAKQVAAAEAAAQAVAGGVQPAVEEKKAMNRDVALGRLREIATFFRESEPHSPVAHHVEEAVRWGEMPLPELLMELIPEEQARKNLFTRIGIPLPVKK